jgi:hypothetical protein
MHLWLSKQAGWCEMKNKRSFGNLFRAISAVALVILFSGCATQSSGSSNLDHDVLFTSAITIPERTTVCNQVGAELDCRLVEQGGSKL